MKSIINVLVLFIITVVTAVAQESEVFEFTASTGGHVYNTGVDGNINTGAKSGVGFIFNTLQGTKKQYGIHFYGDVSYTSYYISSAIPRSIYFDFRAGVGFNDYRIIHGGVGVAYLHNANKVATNAIWAGAHLIVKVLHDKRFSDKHKRINAGIKLEYGADINNGNSMLSAVAIVTYRPWVRN